MSEYQPPEPPPAAPGLREEHVDVVEIGEAATSALDEFDNVRWDDIWARVDASGDDDLAHASRKYVGYVRADIERIIAALIEGDAALAKTPGEPQP